jgi:DNA polymerase-1
MGYSTDAASLEAMHGIEIIDKLLEYRQLTKLKSTYLDALPGLVNPRTGRLHTSYNQIGAITGRISSSEPNLQNIPIRTELGREVRKAFAAQGAPDWLLLSADYSQIELRVLAHISQDPALLAAFHRGEDIHAATASMMFDVPLDKVVPDQRRVAKILNFGVIYGLSAYGISQQTGFSPEQGQKFIDSYFAKYPGIRSYLERTKEQARTQGYVETVLGRRRYMPEIQSGSFTARQAAERTAVNMPIQGTAADIMKVAMIRVHDRLTRDGLKARMLLQVHDELLFELPKEEQELLSRMLREEMGSAMKLAVPLKVDIKAGYTWGDME